jgi:hypothetical protein
VTPLYKMTDLERAEHIATAFEASQRAMWSGMWPLGHCAVSSLLLNPLLTAAMPAWEPRIVVGVAGDSWTHAWIESRYGDVVDPTWGQFVGRHGDLIMDGEDVDLALRVCSAHEAHDYQGEIRLTESQEDFYRRSIDPRQIHSGPKLTSGWTAQSRVKELFRSPMRICPVL